MIHRLAAIAVLIFSGVAAAQSDRAGIAVALTLRDQVAYVGDSVILNIVVINAENPTTPEIMFPDGLAVTALARQDASSQFITQINGRRTVHREFRYTYPYRLTPARPGRYSIGPARITVDGVVYESDVVHLLVQEPQPREDLKLRLTLNKPTAYVGEPVTLTLTWMMRSNISNQFSFTIPDLPPSIETHDFPSPTPTARDIRAGRYAEFEFLGSTVLAERAVVVERGLEWTTYTFAKIIVPTTPGEFSLGPAYFRGAVEVGRRRNSIFGDEPITERAVVPSDRAVLRVLPLPESNQPADFTGLVGAYRVTSRLDRTDMKVGDPVKLSLRISGPPPIERARSIDLLNHPHLTRDFRVSPDDTTTRVDGGTLLIETTVRPLDDRVDELPALSFPYFDPELGEYQTAATRPIPVDVHPTRIVTIDDAIGGDRGARSLDSNAGGFAHNYTSIEILASQRFDTLAFLRSPLAIGAIAAPPALWFLATTVGVIRRARSRRASKSSGARSFVAARADLRAAADAPAIAHALRAYLDSRLDIPPNSSPAEAARTIATIAPDLADAAQTLLEQLDEACFAGAGENTADSLRQDALTLLDQLEPAVRRAA